MENKRRIVFLINPIAGTRSKHGLEEFLANQCRQRSIDYMMVHSTKTTVPETIRVHLHDFKATDLVACGGDGTVNLAAAAVAHSAVNLGIIPVGSGNGLARTANLHASPSKAFQVILNGKLQLTDAFMVNGHFACMLSGLGMDAEVAERFSKSHRRGMVTYTTETLVQFFKSQPINFGIEIDGFRFFTDAFFISVANSNQFGNNVTIAPLASLHDGLLDIIIVQKMPKATLPFALLAQLRHNKLMKNWVEKIGTQTILYLQAKEIRIHNPKHAHLHIDGDPVPVGEDVHFKIIPGAFNLWVP
ncbi:MAG: diacylglycerol kinase [Chitinophagaceae bacterium]|jgi:YegS/Rv2252/BmrU family lipid kinase|nr:diacylglycerol kinase [Chitinophagaceae bacterium]MCU0404161.1 diacylglycerol kinase [Chitinophagaceae bacterium]